MELIALANRRGGCGKTITAQALGAGLQRAGYSVLMIDLDSQCSLTLDMDATAGRFSAIDVLTRDAAALDAITHTPQGDLIPATTELARADVLIRQEYRLKDALGQLDYDYAICDTPPSLGMVTVNALTAAAGVIIPVQPEVHSIDGIRLLYESIRTVQQYSNPALKICGILITRFKGRAIISRDMRENLQDVADQLGTRLYSTPIRECVAAQEAQAMHTNVLDYNKRSNVAKDYEAFIAEFLKERM